MACTNSAVQRLNYPTKVVFKVGGQPARRCPAARSVSTLTGAPLQSAKPAVVMIYASILNQQRYGLLDYGARGQLTCGAPCIFGLLYANYAICQSLRCVAVG
jgi:hypothetical protein